MFVYCRNSSVRSIVHRYSVVVGGISRKYCCQLCNDYTGRFENLLGKTNITRNTAGASTYYQYRLKSSFPTDIDDEQKDEPITEKHNDKPVASQSSYEHQRVWKASRIDDDDIDSNSTQPNYQYWKTRIVDCPNGGRDAIRKLSRQLHDDDDDDDEQVIETLDFAITAGVSAGRLRQTQLGVLHQDPATDMEMIIDNFTVKAMASALRDREDALQQAAQLAVDERYDELKDFLSIFHPKYVKERRTMKRTDRDDPCTHLHTDSSRQNIRKALTRMPRTITTAHSKRAAVCIALCLSDGIPSILLEKRAGHLRAHPHEVCLPGGMACDIQDQTIFATSIREMHEEIIGLDIYNSSSSSRPIGVEVLGVLRLNWGEVQHLTGVAVTPVVCYLGELPNNLYPNPDEVSEVFTIPLIDLLNTSLWVHKEGYAPIYVGGPHIIWGLTGYILERFGKDILKPLRSENYHD